MNKIFSFELFFHFTRKNYANFQNLTQIQIL